jgi:uncharacterized membrane protein YdjX (TVP38/TMEM64 family)
MQGSTSRFAGFIRQWLPALALVVLIAIAYGFGLHRHLSLTVLAENRDQLRLFVDDNLALAVLIYMAIYVTLVALSIPGAAAMSIAGGFLFGWALSVPATVTSAVIGSVIVFQVVKTSAGAALAERTSPFVQRMSQGFSENAFSFLLFLRLAPVFPFFIVNAVAGLCRVPLRTFVIATFIGIIPASIAFAMLGSGLDSVIDAHVAAYKTCIAAQGMDNCHFRIDPSALITRELLIAFAGLGLVALLPVGFKYWKARNNGKA